MPLSHLEQTIVETILPAEAQEQFRLGRIGKRFFSPYLDHIAALSESYCVSGGRQVASRQEAEAYSLYFLLINAAKVLRLLSMLAPTTLSQPQRILDFGCGPCTATLALLTKLSAPASIDCVDSATDMLGVGRDLVNKLCQDLPSLKHTISIGSTPTGVYDLIIAANVFTELTPAQTQLTASKLLEQLAAHGHLIILEPALRHTTRAAMELRDDLLLLDPSLTPLFPCPIRTECPMLRSNDHDWCHGTISWNRPRLIEQLDELIGFNKHRLKYSGFIFARSIQSPTGFRLVTEIQQSKHDHSCIACSSKGYGLLSLAKRRIDDSNRTFTHAKVYDLIPELPTGATFQPGPLKRKAS